jgi:hypothetical protein
MIISRAIAVEPVAVMLIWRSKRVSLIEEMEFVDISIMNITPASFTKTGRIFAVLIDNISCIMGTGILGKTMSK